MINRTKLPNNYNYPDILDFLGITEQMNKEIYGLFNEYTSDRDDKGRIIVPAKLRSLITSMEGKIKYLGVIKCLDSLVLLPSLEYEKIRKTLTEINLKTSSSTIESELDFLSKIISQVPMSTNGRIHLEPGFKERLGIYKGINGTITFIGKGNFIKIFLEEASNGTHKKEKIIH